MEIYQKISTSAPCTIVLNMLHSFSMPKNWCVGNQHHAKHNYKKIRPCSVNIWYQVKSKSAELLNIGEQMNHF